MTHETAQVTSLDSARRRRAARVSEGNQPQEGAAAGDRTDASVLGRVEDTVGEVVHQLHDLIDAPANRALRDVSAYLYELESQIRHTEPEVARSLAVAAHEVARVVARATADARRTVSPGARGGQS